MLLRATMAAALLLSGCVTTDLYNRIGTTVERTSSFDVGETNIVVRETYTSPLLDGLKSLGGVILKGTGT